MAVCQIDEGEFYAWFSFNQIVREPQALCSFSQFDYILIIIKMPNMMVFEECGFFVGEMRSERVAWTLSVYKTAQQREEKIG